MSEQKKTKGRAEDYDKVIGIRLRALRKINNLTQDELAVKMGITFQQVQKYEQGTNRISAGKIKQLINIFSVPSAYFFEDKKNIRSLGFAESEQEPFTMGPNTENQKTRVSEEIWYSTETINLLRSYYSVPDAKARKDILKMVRTYAENIANAKKAD